MGERVLYSPLPEPRPRQQRLLLRGSVLGIAMKVPDNELQRGERKMQPHDELVVKETSSICQTNKALSDTGIH